MNYKLRVGSSIDTHVLLKSMSPQVYLGEVLIDAPYSIVANTNGDVLLHSVSEAIIGALGKGDLGSNFGDSKETALEQELTSKKILLETMRILKEFGTLINIDTTVICDVIYLRDYRKKIVSKLIEMTKCKNINVKFTRQEQKNSNKITGFSTVLLELY